MNEAPPLPNVGALGRWLAEHGLAVDGENLEVTRFGGGNSNETYVVTTSMRPLVIRRPPLHGIDPSAHSMEREWRVLSALDGSAMPVPRALAHCEDTSVLGAPFLVMELVPDSVSILDTLPGPYSEDLASVRRVGEEMVDALVTLQAVDWRAAGLGSFGRPEGFLERQVERWRGQLLRYEVRPLPLFHELADWLDAHRPAAQQPAVMHGDFHLDNCLFARSHPALLSVVDWEMATIGDPLLDLGLCLAFWGPRAIDPPAMPRVEGVSRVPGTPSREQLAERYARGSGRSVADLSWYCCLAFWKLAAVVEGAYAQHVRGQLVNEYSSALEHDVPRLIEEAAAFTTTHGD